MSDSFGSNVAKLLSSKILTQSVSIITAPIIARLFLPEHFGIRQIFMSITSVVVAISGLRYELTIPLGKDDKEAISSFTLSSLLTTFFSLLALALIPFLKARIAEWFKTPELEYFLWLFPVAVFTGGVGASLKYYASRRGKFGVIAWTDFISTASGIFTTILWGLVFGASATGLFVGYFCGTILGVILIFGGLSREFLLDFKNSEVNFTAIWTSAKTYKKFPMFDTWSALLNSISVQLPTFILGLYFSPKIIGYYSQGQRLVGLPMSLLGSSIANVFFPTAAKEYNEKGDLSRIVNITFKRLLQISVLPMITVAFLGSPLFGFIFGQEWIEAGVYSQILSIYFLFSFISMPLFSVYDILRLQGTIMIFNIVLISGRFAGLIIGTELGGPRIALVAYSLFSIIGHILILFRIFRKSSIPLKNAVKTFSKYFLSLFLILPAFCISFFGLSIFYVMIAIVLAFVIYFWFLYRFDSALHDYFANYISRLTLRITKK